MRDFENNELEVGDEVVFILNRSTTTKLKRGKIIKVDVKQFNMLMAIIKFEGEERRVAGWNIFKLPKH